MSLAAFRSTVSRRVCLLCHRSVSGVGAASVRTFAARTRPAVVRHVELEQRESAQLPQPVSLPSPAAAVRQRGRPRKVAASKPQPQAQSQSEPLPEPQLEPHSHPAPQPQPRTPTILELLLPEREPEAPTSVAPRPPQPQPQPVSEARLDEEVTGATGLLAAAAAEASTSAARASGPTILDLLRPEPEDETPTPRTFAPQSIPTAFTVSTNALVDPKNHASTVQADDEDDDTIDSLPAGSAHDPDAASAELLSADTSISDAEFERFMTEPLAQPPTFDEMEQQVDSLLRLEVRGRRMFPLYMRDQLKLATLTHMRDVIQQLFPQLSAASTATTPTTALTEPVTQHTLHSRLFTFLIKRGSKLAHSTDERITILCPEAPAVGEKVPHPQWPEMTTVVRRDFAVSWGGEMGIELEDEERVLRAGKVKMRELFSGVGMDSAGVDSGFMMDDGDMLVDLDALNVDVMQFREETEPIPPPPPNASDTARMMYDSQVEARQHAVAFLKERIRKLQQRRELYLRKGSGAEGDADVNARTKDGGTHVLAVVYKFDGESGEEFEIRYPLSKRDVERMQLFEEGDEADTVIRMNPVAKDEDEA